MAARRLGRADAAQPARSVCSALAADARPYAGDAARAPAVLAAHRAGAVATGNPNWRQRSGHRVRHLPVREPAPSARAGADKTDAIGALVFCGGGRAWRRTDAGADLSRP